MLQARHQWILAALLMLHPSILLAQEDHIQYGLYGTYQSAGAPAFSRVDTDLMFDWTDGAPAVTVGPDFQGRWTGQILIRSQKPYRFSSELLGHVTVQIGEQTVFDGRAVEPTYVTGEPVDVPLGFQDLQVTFQSLPQGGMLKLFWATDDFQTEPVPAHLLFHEDDSNGAKLVETGRQLFEAHRCHRCHTGVLDQELLPAPALWGITNGTNPQWIVQKLMNKNAEAAHAKMPDFGLDEQQADDIAQYLHRLGVPFDLVTAPAPKENDKQPSGDELLHSLGCLGCHQVGELGTTGPFAGSDLTHIGAKRSPDWLATWLSTPERINPQHHMPAFKLDRTERGLLAHALSKLGREDGMKYNVSDTVIPTVQVDRGRELVKRLHCANCHKIPAIEADLRPFPQLRQPIDDWSATCLADKPDLAAGRPHFPKTNREALKAYVNTIAGQTPHPLSTQERGRLVLNRNNCLGCHRRGMELGLAS
ncbi:MAG: c-type cytochrome, partial [Planctomycetaceae bacterium]|nr:c-type cytochrome [Planctomycetaceae bacterium]